MDSSVTPPSRIFEIRFEDAVGRRGLVEITLSLYFDIRSSISLLLKRKREKILSKSSFDFKIDSKILMNNFIIDRGEASLLVLNANNSLLVSKDIGNISFPSSPCFVHLAVPRTRGRWSLRAGVDGWNVFFRHRREGKEGLDKQVEPAPHSAGCQRGQTRMSRGEGKLMRGSASGGFPLMSSGQTISSFVFLVVP